MNNIRAIVEEYVCRIIFVVSGIVFAPTILQKYSRHAEVQDLYLLTSLFILLVLFFYRISSHFSETDQKIRKPASKYQNLKSVHLNDIKMRYLRWSFLETINKKRLFIFYTISLLFFLVFFNFWVYFLVKIYYSFNTIHEDFGKFLTRYVMLYLTPTIGVLIFLDILNHYNNDSSELNDDSTSD